MGQEIIPGPCPPEGCPEPKEIVCVVVDKVYDACSQIRCIEVDLEPKISVTPDDLPVEIIECRIENFQITTSITQIQDDPPLVRILVSYSYDVVVEYKTEGEEIRTVSEEVSKSKKVILFGTEEMDVRVERVIECLGCDIIDDKIRCEVGEFFIIKTVLEVQLLIPAYGFCPTPPECEELPTRCEEFLADPPRLFPPQPWEFIDKS